MRNRSSLTTVLAAVLLVSAMAGCGLFSEEAALKITTDKAEYLRGSTINVSAKNVSSEVIYYNSCMPSVLEELSDGKVSEQIALPVCQCLCITQLKPGENWEWSLEVDWLWANDGMFEPEVGPRHRFRFEFYQDAKLTNLVRPDELLTNAFRFERDEAAQVLVYSADH